MEFNNLIKNINKGKELKFLCTDSEVIEELQREIDGRTNLMINLDGAVQFSLVDNQGTVTVNHSSSMRGYKQIDVPEWDLKKDYFKLDDSMVKYNNIMMPKPTIEKLDW